MATPMNILIIQNTQTRGDAIAIVDLVSYSGGTVSTAKMHKQLLITHMPQLIGHGYK